MYLPAQYKICNKSQSNKYADQCDSVQPIHRLVHGHFFQKLFRTSEMAIHFGAFHFFSIHSVHRKHCTFELKKEGILECCTLYKLHNGKGLPSKAYLTYETYVTHWRYPGIVSKLTKKPENRIVGIVDTGPKNTPASTLNPAPISKPRLWATSDVSTQMNTNMDMRCSSNGWEVK